MLVLPPHISLTTTQISSPPSRSHLQLSSIMVCFVKAARVYQDVIWIARGRRTKWDKCFFTHCKRFLDAIKIDFSTLTFLVADNTFDFKPYLQLEGIRLWLNRNITRMVQACFYYRWLPRNCACRRRRTQAYEYVNVQAQMQAPSIRSWIMNKLLYDLSAWCIAILEFSREVLTWSSKRLCSGDVFEFDTVQLVAFFNRGTSSDFKASRPS